MTLASQEISYLGCTGQSSLLIKAAPIIMNDTLRQSVVSPPPYERRKPARIQLKLLNCLNFLLALLWLSCLSDGQQALAQNLPKGVRAAAYVYGFASGISSSFNSHGNLESLVKPLNRSVSIDTLGQYEPQILTLKNVVNGIGPNQLGDQLVMANLYADLQVREVHNVFALLWGLTDRFTVGAIVPVIKRQVHTEFHVDVVNNSEALMKGLGSASPQLTEGLRRLKEAGLDTPMFEKHIFTDHGLQNPSDFEASGLGDVQLETRYQYFQGARYGCNLRGTLRLPTTTYTPNVTNLFDRPIDEGNVSVKVGMIHSYTVVPGIFTVNSATFFTVRAPRQILRAVPKTPDDILPDVRDPYQVEEISKVGGSQLNQNFGLSVDAWRGVLSFGVTYQYTAHAQDMYYGTRQLNYHYLMSDTASQEHGVEFSAEVSAIPLFLEKISPVPAKIFATWYQPFAGQNTVYTPYGSINVVMLF